MPNRSPTQTPRHHRREVLAGLAALPALTAWPARAASDVPLAELAAASGFRFGSVFDSEVFDDPAYVALLQRQTGFVGNANAFKYDWLRPWGPAADFATADRLLDIATQSGKPFTAQSLFWNDYPPKWLIAEPKNELQRLFESHITETLTHYRGRIDTWVVVNEPFAPWDDSDGMYRKGPWFTAFGPDYIARAFRAARDRDPTAKLMLNEGWCERGDDFGRKVRTKLLDLVKQMKDADVPLDVVGLQGHLQPQFGIDDDGYSRFITNLAANGVEVRITELDCDDTQMRGSPTQRDVAVAKRYAAFLSVVLENPAIESVCMWGLTDRYTWYTDVAKAEADKRGTTIVRSPRPLPFDRQLNAKPAYAAIADSLRKAARQPAPSTGNASDQK